MRLDQALVIRGLVASRTEAQEMIERELVSVNGKVAIKQTKEVKEADILSVSGRRDFVSRGGDKLRGVFQDIYGEDEVIRTSLSDKVALDIGSSTGGFTNCLLSYGASHIDAVDVGIGQFHESLRNDKRINLYESTDIRNFSSLRRYDIIVADLSFISLEPIFDIIANFGTEKAEYFLLIKPQFEVGKGNTKKGIVKDPTLVSDVLRKYEVLAKMHCWSEVQLLPCHIQGGDGNQEYFLYGKKG